MGLTRLSAPDFSDVADAVTWLYDGDLESGGVVAHVGDGELEVKMGHATYEVTGDLSLYDAVSISVELRGLGLGVAEACSVEASFDDFATSTVLASVSAADNGVSVFETLVIPEGATPWNDGLQLRFIADTLTDDDKCRLSFARSCASVSRINKGDTTTSTSSSTSSSTTSTPIDPNLAIFAQPTTDAPFQCEGPLDCLPGWVAGAAGLVIVAIIAGVAYQQHSAAVARVMIYATEPSAPYQPARRGFWNSMTGLPGGAPASGVNNVMAGVGVAAAAGAGAAAAAAAAPPAPPEPAPGSPGAGAADAGDAIDGFGAASATRMMIDEIASLIDDM